MTKKKSKSVEKSEDIKIAEESISVSFEFATKEQANQVADAFAENGYFATILKVGPGGIYGNCLTWIVEVINKTRDIRVMKNVWVREE